MLNTLRHVINDDVKWWRILFNYSLNFRHKIIDTETVIAYFNSASGMNLTPIFTQYLYKVGIPFLEIKRDKKKLEFRWNSETDNFNMPVDITIDGQKVRINPKNKWTKSKFKLKEDSKYEVLTNDFYITVLKQ
jgi:aminopeptidase N